MAFIMRATANKLFDEHHCTLYRSNRIHAFHTIQTAGPKFVRSVKNCLSHKTKSSLVTMNQHRGFFHRNTTTVYLCKYIDIRIYACFVNYTISTRTTQQTPNCISCFKLPQFWSVSFFRSCRRCHVW
jgi:hypothetical protein